MFNASARRPPSAAARFRVQAPNSTPRAISVIALDEVSHAIVRRLAKGGWKHATFLIAAPGTVLRDASHEPPDAAPGEGPDLAGDGPPASADGTLTDLAGHTRSVTDEIDTADLVILVAGPGGRAHAAETVGQACSLRHITTTGFIVGVAAASEFALSQTLVQLRPWSLMMVIANDDDYIEDMMRALRA
jgi:hypothetical protein